MPLLLAGRSRLCAQCYVRCSLISCPPPMCAAAGWWLHFGTLRCRAAQPLLLLQRCPYGHHSQGGDGSFLGEEHQIQPSFVPSHLHLQVRLRVGAPTWVWGPHTPTSQGRMLTAPPSIGAFSADALPSSVPFAIPRLPLHIPHSLPFLSARIPGITECRTPTRGCRAVQEHRAVPRPTAPCPPPCPHFADRLLPLQVVAAHGHVHHAPRHRRCSQLRCVHLRLLWASELWLLAELYLPVPLQL